MVFEKYQDFTKKYLKYKKKYLNIKKIQLGGFKIGDDVIDPDTMERGIVVSIDDPYVNISRYGKTSRIREYKLKLYTEYESQQKTDEWRKLFQSNDQPGLKRFEQRESMAKAQEDSQKKTLAIEREKALEEGKARLREYRERFSVAKDFDIPELDRDFVVGQRVIIIHPSSYGSGSDFRIPLGSIGTIREIFHRYKGTPHDHKQYLVEIDNPLG